jgi:hypothetical protein
MNVTESMDRPRHSHRRRRWLAAGVFLLGACGAVDSVDADRVVTVPHDAIQVLTSLDVVTRVVDLEPTSDGGVWVLNSIAPYFVVVGPDGRVERQFGLQGGGPGEFNRPIALVRGMGPGEVWAYDWGRNALIDISAGERRELALPRDSFPLPSLISFKGAGINPAPPWLERTRDGFLLARARATREESALHLWNADILLVQEGPETRVDPYMPVGDLLGDPASRYGAATVLIPYPLWTACTDGSLGLYDPLANTLRRFTEEHEEIGALALPDERRLPMTADLIFEMFYRQFAGDRPSAQVPDKEQMRRLTAEQNDEFVRNSASFFPEYSDLRCVSDGTFWLRRFDATSGRLGQGPDWLRAAADGSRTRVVVPREFTVFRIGRWRIWGTLQDSLGVEAIAWIGLRSLR